MSAFTLPRRRPVWRWVGVACLVMVVLIGLAGNESPLFPLVEGLGFLSRLVWGLGIWLVIFYYAFRGRTDADDRVAVANSLADMLEMEIPLEEALEHQVYELEHRFTSRATPLARAMPRVLQSVRRGSSLSDAVGRQKTFPTAWRPILQASEGQGTLVPGLRTVAQLEAGGGIFDAGTLVRVFATLSILAVVGPFLTRYIFPTFLSLFHNLGVAEPWLEWLNVIPPLVGVCLLGAALLFLRPVQTALRTLLTWIPGEGRFICLQEQHQICNALAGALELDLPLQDAVRLSAQTCRTSRYGRAMQEGTPGDSLSQVFTRHPRLFDSTLRWMVAAAERVSTPLPEVLRTAATWFAEEGERQRERASVVLSVLLSLGTGVLVAIFCLGTLGSLAHLVTALLQRGIMP
ncbi:MAG TPA: type II secretion system F family protein [Candidatus Xenobia bacterium]|jgi:type II secretory pathway component PulF